MWGKGGVLVFSLGRGRIIPTRVGKSPTRPCGVPSAEDHPHACGEKQPSSLQTLSNWGSSPRVWGKVCVYGSFAKLLRIIPTRVGESQRPFYMGRVSWEHPHTCGEKLLAVLVSLNRPGSSPRVWGKEEEEMYNGALARIIPTRVGKSLSI